MEKLFDFTKGDPECKLYRFQCDCLEPGDALDVNVDCYKEDKKFFVLCLQFNDSDFWSRVKYAWHILRGKWTWREFVVREEDHKDLADIFNPGKGFSELP